MTLKMYFDGQAGLRIALGLLMAWVMATVSLMAQTDTVAAGSRIFRQKGDCQACHGWAGDGRKMDSQMPDGANLRESLLDREQLIFVIKCAFCRSSPKRKKAGTRRKSKRNPAQS